MSFFDRLPTDAFKGVAVFEKTSASHVVLSWSSPRVAPELRSVLTARCNFQEPSFGRYGEIFHYTFATPASTACVTVLAKAFMPEALLTLSKVLLELYGSTGRSNVAVQAAYLSAYTTGRIPRSIDASGAVPQPAADLSFDLSAFDARKNFKPTGAKAMLSNLGVEAIIAWTALMLGKRVAVFGPNLADVIRTVRLLPLLVAHRFSGIADGVGATNATPASLMFPYVTLSDHLFATSAGANAANSVSFEGPMGAAFARQVAEAVPLQLSDLLNARCFVAGFTDPAVLDRGGEAWDILCHIGDKSVTIAPTAKADLALGSVHKEVAKALLEALAAPDATDVSVLAALAGKTIQLVDRLKAWFPSGIQVSAPEPYQTVLRAQSLPANVERFLWGIAVAEPSLQASVAPA
jgi:hypothetical protein